MQSGIKLISGLGNPGSEYKGTKHNAGFELIDKLQGSLPGSYSRKEKFSGVYFKGRFKGENIFLQKPMTFMNVSGKAVSALMRFFKIEPSELLVVYDDLDLPLGRMRIRHGGSSGGHNGIESIIEHLGSADFARLRLGIGRPSQGSGKDYVLSKFSDSEQKLFDLVLGEAEKAVKCILSRGISEAMNSYNGLKLDKDEEESEEKE